MAGGAKRSLSHEFELAVLREDSSAQQGELLRAVEELRVSGRPRLVGQTCKTI